MLLLTINNSLEHFDICGMIAPAMLYNFFSRFDFVFQNFLVEVSDFVRHSGPNFNFTHAVVVVFEAEKHMV